MFEGELWPGQVTKVSGNSIRVKCLEKDNQAGSTWRWPQKLDEADYDVTDVKQRINTPQCVPGASSLRNIVVKIPELAHIWK